MVDGDRDWGQGPGLGVAGLEQSTLARWGRVTGDNQLIDAMQNVTVTHQCLRMTGETVSMCGGGRVSDT